MSGCTTVLAPAKVNLFLRVLDRRPDGFHELETLFQAVDLADEVELELSAGGIELEVDGADLGPPEENLAYRAAQALIDAVEPDVGVRIRLTKRIPAGAGLGGGSSDAAAVLLGLDALLESRLGAGALQALGATLGSDVPFFLGSSPLAVGRGRGEVLTPMPPLPVASLVLVLPPVHVSTAAAYGALARHRAAGTGGAETSRRLTAAPERWEEVVAVAWNDFQEVIAPTSPEVESSLAALAEEGGRPALLSGSGAACFGLFGDPEPAEASARSLRARLGWEVRVVRTLEELPGPRSDGG